MYTPTPPTSGGKVNDSITHYNIYLAEDAAGTNRQQLTTADGGASSGMAHLLASMLAGMPEGGETAAGGASSAAATSAVPSGRWTPAPGA